MASSICVLVHAFIHLCCSRCALCLRNNFQTSDNDSARTHEELRKNIAVDERALLRATESLSLLEEQSASEAPESLAAEPEGFKKAPFMDFISFADASERPVREPPSRNLSLLSYAQALAGMQALSGRNFPLVWVCVGPIVALACLVVVILALQRSASSEHGGEMRRVKSTTSRRAAKQESMGPQPSMGGGRRSSRGVEDYPVVQSDSAFSHAESQRTRTSEMLSSSDFPRGGVDHPSASYSAVTASPLADVPLCPLLVVPENTRLACVVQNDVCRRKQELTFNISGLSSCGGAPLFQIRVSDQEASAPGIFAESLDGKDQLAFLSTEELWQGVASPVLRIARPSGAAYGTMQKTEAGDYRVSRGGVELLRFTGDFAGHNIQVVDPSGRAVANTWQTSPEEYQAHVYALFDASLVIIGFVAIDKCEISSGALTPPGS